MSNVLMSEAFFYTYADPTAWENFKYISVMAFNGIDAQFFLNLHNYILSIKIRLFCLETNIRTPK